MRQTERKKRNVYSQISIILSLDSQNMITCVLNDAQGGGVFLRVGQSRAYGRKGV